SIKYQADRDPPPALGGGRRARAVEPLLLDPEGRERTHRTHGCGQIPVHLAAAATFEHPIAVWIETSVVWPRGKIRRGASRSQYGSTVGAGSLIILFCRAERGRTLLPPLGSSFAG